MENPSAAEDFVDIATVRFLDLRSLGQDEIQIVARLCGDVPARLQDLVNVMVDKSIFNESAGSRRQTYDRERVPRNKDRRLSPASASAQLHLAVEAVGRSHRDLIVHLCRQLHIAEKGDGALYQSCTQPVVGDGNRTVRLKRMARVPFTGGQDPSVPSSSAAANGKAVAAEVSHRSSKKMKTKEEARRRSAIVIAEPQAEAVRDGSELQEEKQAMQIVKYISSGSEECFIPKEVSTRAVSVVVMNASTQVQSDSKSSETLIAQSTSALMEEPEPLKSKHTPLLGKLNKISGTLCGTCGKTFANTYSLRRHATTAGHMVDKKFRKRISRKKKVKKGLIGHCLCITCGNNYATPFTLKRHAITTGHALNKAIKPTAERQQLENRDDIEGNDSEKRLTLAKPKLETYWPRRSWKNKVRQFKCRQCHRTFSRKKQYVDHLDTHYKKSRKITGRPVGRSSGKAKGRRIGRPPKLDGAGHTKQAREERKRKHEPESLGRRVRSRMEEGSIPRTPEKPTAITCQECGKVFDGYSRYTGHLSMHSRSRRFYAGETSKKNISGGRQDSVSGTSANDDMLNIKVLSALGFRRLLGDTTGTYLSGLPAKLLFSRSLDLSDLQTGEV